MQQRTRQQSLAFLRKEETSSLLSRVQKKGKKTTNDTLNNSWTLGRHLFLVSPPKRQKSRLLILLRSAHARKRLSLPLSLLQNVSSHRTRRRRIEETTRKDRFERERKVAWWWWSSRACPLRGTKVFGRDKICVCFRSNEEKETKKKGQHHDHDGRVHANAHAVAGEERADGGRAGL